MFKKLNRAKKTINFGFSYKKADLPFDERIIFAIIMIKLTQHTLDKIEDLLTMAGYKVRNEKGNFKSGSCVIENSNIIVLNKFAPVEAKVSYLVEAIRSLNLDESLLDEKSQKFLQELKVMELTPTDES